MIEAIGLSKRYGPTLAVDDLSFTVPPGQVTGFLGPNGAGKSTTMRMILGLDAPTAGAVTVNDKPYTRYRRPLHEVGALLDAQAVHGGRDAYHHLHCLALSNGIRRSRVNAVLDQVGLRGVAQKRVGGFSLGMKQRLGIAAVLLGDPPVLIFDEPINGLDPEGVLWIRNLLTALAGEGRTVLLSSHLMSEMAVTADRLIIIGRGRLLAQTTVAEFLAAGADTVVQVRTPHAGVLHSLLEAQGATVTAVGDNTLRVAGATGDDIGELARLNGWTLQELSTQQVSLEQRYMELTAGSVDYRTAAAASAPARN
ncbi:MAG: ATP-binding cassette domain-containing protein [Actinomycetota bacterium]